MDTTVQVKVAPAEQLFPPVSQFPAAPNTNRIRTVLSIILVLITATLTKISTILYESSGDLISLKVAAVVSVLLIVIVTCILPAITLENRLVGKPGLNTLLWNIFLR